MGISKHELHGEFPQYSGLIDELKAKDLKFQEQLKEYSDLDQEIEGLELRDSPIGDDKLHRMKQKRAQLKDNLYQELTRQSEASG
ncbi:MAG: YdcH family protein [Pseudomonadota bacterium]